MDTRETTDEPCDPLGLCPHVDSYLEVHPEVGSPRLAC